jgi:CcmD family protein
MDNIDYFFAAYIFVWIVLFLYLFSVSRRERKIRSEIEELSQLVARSKE